MKRGCDEQKTRCQFCNEWYEFYSHLAGDQSCCPQCRQEAGTTGGGRVIKCPTCGRLYAFARMLVGDQSRCPECRTKELSPDESWTRLDDIVGASREIYG